MRSVSQKNRGRMAAPELLGIRQTPFDKLRANGAEVA
jgi:hypothetical protein